MSTGRGCGGCGGGYEQSGRGFCSVKCERDHYKHCLTEIAVDTRVALYLLWRVSSHSKV
jgi:hypothetical protein